MDSLLVQPRILLQSEWSNTSYVSFFSCFWTVVVPLYRHYLKGNIEGGKMCLMV